jgi:hypothetical protein
LRKLRFVTIGRFDESDYLQIVTDMTEKLGPKLSRREIRTPAPTPSNCHWLAP